MSPWTMTTRLYLDDLEAIASPEVRDAWMLARAGEMVAVYSRLRELQAQLTPWGAFPDAGIELGAELEHRSV